MNEISMSEFAHQPLYATTENVQTPLAPGLGARLAQEWAEMERMTRAELQAKYWPNGGPAWLLGPPKPPATHAATRLCESYLLEWIREITRVHAGQWLQLCEELEKRTLENSRLQKQIRDHDYETTPRRLNGAVA